MIQKIIHKLLQNFLIVVTILICTYNKSSIRRVSAKETRHINILKTI